QPPVGVEAADRVPPANDAAILAHDTQGQVLPRETFERVERWPGALDATHVRGDVLNGCVNVRERPRPGHESQVYPKMQRAGAHSRACARWPQPPTSGPGPGSRPGRGSAD